MEATTKKTAKAKMVVPEEQKTGTPRYNKTWEAVLKFRGTVKVNDPTLYYR